MEVTIVSTKQTRDPGITFYVAFGPDETAQGTKSDFIPDPGDEDPDYEEKYNIKTGAQDTLKVLATVVQAVKNTATKIGGMDKVYQMAWQPSDKKRKNIYDYYVQTLFPDFKKNSTEQSQFQSYVNKNFKPKNKISEIGDASKEPYSPIDTISDTEDERQYGFSTESGTIYQVDVVTFYRGPMDPVIARVNFGTITDDGDIDYDTQTEENNIYRIMSTIVSIVKKDLKSNHADVIEFSPTKREGRDIDKDPLDNVRTKLYLRYIKSQFPNSEVKQTLYGDIQVDLRK